MSKPSLKRRRSWKTFWWYATIPNVFSEFTGFPLDREIEFSIDLMPGT
jgi:hypothetical protein